jgi:hypothetical protein
VVEREAVELLESDRESGFYPLKCLLPGVAWPSDVDPSKREQYLNPEEFERTFGMTKVSSIFVYPHGGILSIHLALHFVCRMPLILLTIDTKSFD